MTDLDRLIEWHKNELRHINSALETHKPARAKSRWENRRRNHERTVQELLRLQSLDGLRELQQESERLGLYDTDQPSSAPAALTCEHGNMVGGCVACALADSADVRRCFKCGHAAHNGDCVNTAPDRENDAHG